jgi:DNA-binding NarL/FixJ family response regulator
MTEPLSPAESLLYEKLIHEPAAIKIIAADMGKAYKTVDAQLRMICTKLGYHGRTELLVAYIRELEAERERNATRS